jgi:hypothetical protein
VSIAAPEGHMYVPAKKADPLQAKKRNSSKKRISSKVLYIVSFTH